MQNSFGSNTNTHKTVINTNSRWNRKTHLRARFSLSLSLPNALKSVHTRSPSFPRALSLSTSRARAHLSFSLSLSLDEKWSTGVKEHSSFLCVNREHHHLLSHEVFI